MIEYYLKRGTKQYFRNAYTKEITFVLDGYNLDLKYGQFMYVSDVKMPNSEEINQYSYTFKGTGAFSQPI